MDKEDYFKYRPAKGFGGLSVDEVEMGNRIVGEALDDIFAAYVTKVGIELGILPEGTVL